MLYLLQNEKKAYAAVFMRLLFRTSVNGKRSLHEDHIIKIITEFGDL